MPNQENLNKVARKKAFSDTLVSGTAPTSSLARVSKRASLAASLADGTAPARNLTKVLAKTALAVAIAAGVAASQTLARAEARVAFSGDLASGTLVTPTPTPTPSGSYLDTDFDLDLEGWLILMDGLVVSDGSRSLGTVSDPFNADRDQGSRLAFFDPVNGNNGTGQYYWWNGTNIIDSAGNIANPGNSEIYGTNPLFPNLLAIEEFASIEAANKTQQGTSGRGSDWRFDGLAGGYPDWNLLRRGETHTSFGTLPYGGRSEAEPMVMAGYGPLADGRAVVDATIAQHNWGDAENWIHTIFNGLRFTETLAYNEDCAATTTLNGSGGPCTLYIEDCDFPGYNGAHANYPITKTILRRINMRDSWHDDHNQGVFTDNSYTNILIMDTVNAYRNGYKTDPFTDPNPERDRFSRNYYIGGGSQLGTIMINCISADGASGGPQLRFGAIAHNNLIIEGYYFASTNSNSLSNPWLPTATGKTADFRGNFQFIYQFPNPNQTDPLAVSEPEAQNGVGCTLQGATFGAVVDDCICSGAMYMDDLGFATAPTGPGFRLALSEGVYQDTNSYSPQNNTVSNCLSYRTAGSFAIVDDPDAPGSGGISSSGHEYNNNVSVSDTPFANTASNCTEGVTFTRTGNTEYTIAEMATAISEQGWTDPNRTLKRYVQEVLGLTLLEWADDPNIIGTPTVDTVYDPMGLKTFMAIAQRMRRGGVDAIPSSGKPALDGDYPWDDRFTAIAVINWCRAGFNKAPVVHSVAWPLAA